MKMQDYVRHSPVQVEKNLIEIKKLIEPVASKIAKKEYNSIYFVASGSSYNAALMALPLWQRNSLKPVYLFTPDNILNDGYNQNTKPIFIVISQSGSSTNVTKCLKKLKEKNASIIVLTGYVNSPARKYTTNIFDYGAGNEYIDFVTQGVQTLYEFLLFLGIKLLIPEKFENENRNANTIYKNQQTTLKTTQKFINDNKIALSTDTPVIFVGNNYNFGVAKEFALKVAETLKRPGIYYESEEFLHGPDMQVTPGYTIYLLDDFPSNPRILNIYKGLRKITNYVYLVTTNTQIKSDKNCILLAKPTSAKYYVFETLLVFQLICSELSDELKTWPTHPFFNYLETHLQIKSSSYEEELKQLKKEWEVNNNDSSSDSNSRITS